MDDLIERRLAYIFLSEYYNHTTEIQHKNLIEALSRVPSADVQEIKHGQWVQMSDADGLYYCCSECGEELYREWTFDRQFDLFPKLKTIDKTAYCPNCGAKMKS